MTDSLTREHPFAKPVEFILNATRTSVSTLATEFSLLYSEEPRVWATRIESLRLGKCEAYIQGELTKLGTPLAKKLGLPYGHVLYPPQFMGQPLAYGKYWNTDLVRRVHVRTLQELQMIAGAKKKEGIAAIAAPAGKPEEKPVVSTGIPSGMQSAHIDRYMELRARYNNSRPVLIEALAAWPTFEAAATEILEKNGNEKPRKFAIEAAKLNFVALLGQHDAVSANLEKNPPPVLRALAKHKQFTVLHLLTRA